MPAKILIVEDDEPVGSLEQTIVELRGHEVHWVRSPMDAKEEALRSKPDVIIMDVMMPRKNGLDAAREIRNDPELATIPILFVSVLDLQERFSNDLPDPPIGFVRKPFEIDDLMEAIAKLTKR